MTMSRIYFYGDARVPEDRFMDGGHYLNRRSADGTLTLRAIEHEKRLPVRLWREVGRHSLVGDPFCNRDSAHGGYDWANEDQPEGVVRLVHLDGFTVIGFWDRTGDPRHGCASQILAEGEHTFDAMIAIFRATFPELYARVTARGQLREHHGNPRPARPATIAAQVQAASATPEPAAGVPIDDGLWAELTRSIATTPAPTVVTSDVAQTKETAR